MSPLDPSTIIPFRAGDSARRGWRVGLPAATVEALVSLVLNVIVVGGLVQLAFPRVLDRREPQSITVDLVPDVPKGTGPSAPSAGKPSSDTPPAAKADTKPDAAAAKTETTPAPPQPDPAKPTNEAPTEPKTDFTAAPAQTPAPAAETPTPPATPASIEGDRNAAPRLVAAPNAPAAAETQVEKPVAANAETKPAAADRVAEQPPAPAPQTLSNPGADDALPPPSSAAETPKPSPEPTAAEKREAENTARLAAALPFAQGLPPSFARAALSGTGEALEQRYRGEVYGQFRKADDLIDKARAAHLRGQTVVAFSVDDSGALTGVHVAVSSGNPEVDRIAEDIIRRSAPFPAPPPGAQHSFSPAIRLGLDD